MPELGAVLPQQLTGSHFVLMQLPNTKHDRQAAPHEHHQVLDRNRYQVLDMTHFLSVEHESDDGDQRHCEHRPLVMCFAALDVREPFDLAREIGVLVIDPGALDGRFGGRAISQPACADGVRALHAAQYMLEPTETIE